MLKGILLVIILGFGLTSLVDAKGEGPALGKAWDDLNDVCKTIATVDPTTGLYVWNKAKIYSNGEAAKAELATIREEVDLCNDDDANAVTGKNSISHINRLIKHALKAIKDLGPAVN